MLPIHGVKCSNGAGHFETMCAALVSLFLQVCHATFVQVTSPTALKVSVDLPPPCFEDFLKTSIKVAIFCCIRHVHVLCSRKQLSLCMHKINYSVGNDVMLKPIRVATLYTITDNLFVSIRGAI